MEGDSHRLLLAHANTHLALSEALDPESPLPDPSPTKL